MITPEIRDELYRYIGGITNGEGVVLLEIGGVRDHVHMVVKLKPVHSVSDIMRKVKGSSSKWVNKQELLSSKFSWQDGFGAFSVKYDEQYLWTKKSTSPLRGLYSGVIIFR